MKSTYVLIDYENVQPSELVVLDQEHIHVMVFVGAQQQKLSFETVDALQRMGRRAEYVKVSGNGPNALDFHVAYYLGQLALTDPEARFIIVSKDAGFDRLIEHMQASCLMVERHQGLPSLVPQERATQQGIQAPAPSRLALVVANLRQRTGKPRTRQTLASTINSLFQKNLGDDQISELIEGLVEGGFVTIEGTVVTYLLDPPSRTPSPEPAGS